MHLDLKLNGSKPSFNMLIAFAPHELVPVLENIKTKETSILTQKLKAQFTWSNALYRC